MERLVERLQRCSPAISEILRVSGGAAVSLGVLHAGKIIHTAHFGDLDVTAKGIPDDDSVYHIASLTKAFTAAAIARLVHEGKLDWTSRISDIIPEFRNRDDEVGRHATIVDLLCHRAGLAGANALWVQRRQKMLMPKEQTIRTCVHIPAMAALGERWMYNNWAYGLLAEVVQMASGQRYDDFVQRSLLDPLSMGRTTFGTPDGENVAKAHMSTDDGTPRRVAPPQMTAPHPLAGAGGGKSTVRDLLLFYKSLLHSYQDQNKTGKDFTTDSPFYHANQLFEPMIGIGDSDKEKEGYALGWVRTVLPGKLSVVGRNDAWLGNAKIPLIGKRSPGKVVMYHHGNLVGVLASAYLIPETGTAVIALSNAHPLADPSDWAGQMIMETILGEDGSHDFVQLALDTRNGQLSSYAENAHNVQNAIHTTQARRPLNEYCGIFMNKAQNFSLQVSVQGQCLKMNVQGFDDVSYLLQPYTEDGFYWPVNREEEQCEQYMFAWIWPGIHQVSFQASEGTGIDGLTWYHDPSNHSSELFKRIPEEGIRSPPSKSQ